jgi:hypothetical protein
MPADWQKTAFIYRRYEMKPKNGISFLMLVLSLGIFLFAIAAFLASPGGNPAARLRLPDLP